MRGATYSTPSVTTEFRIQNHSRSCGLQRRGGTGLLAGCLTVLGIPDGNRSLTVAAREESPRFCKGLGAGGRKGGGDPPKRLPPPLGLVYPRHYSGCGRMHHSMRFLDLAVIRA